MEFHVFCPNIYVPTKILELLLHLKLLFVIVYIDDAVTRTREHYRGLICRNLNRSLSNDERTELSWDD